MAKRLQPKVVIAENVKGILMGKAKRYKNRLISELTSSGYVVKYFLLDASKMGVPQRRQRVFFIGVRKDISDFLNSTKNDYEKVISPFPNIDMVFNEKEISYIEIEQKEPKDQQSIVHIPEGILLYWKKIKEGRSCADAHPKGHLFQSIKLARDRPLPTLRASSNSYYHYNQERSLYDREIVLGSSFPTDYNFNSNRPIYIYVVCQYLL